jgi:hypothetical protein
MREEIRAERLHTASTIDEDISFIAAASEVGKRANAF